MRLKAKNGKKKKPPPFFFPPHPPTLLTPPPPTGRKRKEKTMLELHVWGPGFDLPSIDPLCIAAIAYLNLTVPSSEWRLIPSSNPFLSPSRA